MIIEQLRKMANPYSGSTKLSARQFVGREDAVAALRMVLEEYQKKATLKNILVSGEKAIGKSTLLNRYKQILQDYNFVVHEIELSTDSATAINEFQIIKEIIDELFTRYSGTQGGFFDSGQSEIWFSLTSGNYQHESNFMERQIRFATKYANVMRGVREEISYKDLESDFKNVIDQLLAPNMEFTGFAILIDEFQELARNTRFLDILRMLSESLPGLLVIGAGLPTFLDNRSFEKFCRSASIIQLKNMPRDEILELIYKPIEQSGKFSRFEVQECFAIETIQKVIKRSAGNPLHVNILCSKMFNYIQNNPSVKTIALNRAVMDDVMDYYSTISEKSKRIENSLRTCSRDQLEAFRRLYYYEGLSLLALVNCNLAFNSIQPDAQEAVRRRLIEDFREIDDLGLFAFSENNIRIGDIEKASINSLANIEFRFIGNTIDKLYVSYFYEDLTKQQLEHREERGYEDILANKLSDEINKSIGARKIPPTRLTDEPFVWIDSLRSGKGTTCEELIKDLNTLVTTEIKDFKKEENSVAVVKDISKRLGLYVPAWLTSVLELDGHYLLITNANIKGKNRTIFSLFPFKGEIDKIEQVRQQVTDYTEIIRSPLAEYMVSINWMYVYWLPKQPLLNIYIIDLRGFRDELYTAVRERRFTDAIKTAQIIDKMDVKIRKEYMLINVDVHNNYGFCLINIDNLNEAMVWPRFR